MKLSKKSIQELKAWYERESGKKITDEQAEEMADNLLHYIKLLESWKAKASNDTSNSESDKSQLVEEQSNFEEFKGEN